MHTFFIIKITRYYNLQFGLAFLPLHISTRVGLQSRTTQQTIRTPTSRNNPRDM
jgi:hypothetical protein